MYHLSMIDSYELGQLLSLLLWILLPATVLSIIINTWLQYRRRWHSASQVLLYEGMEEEKQEGMEEKSYEGVEKEREEEAPIREEGAPRRESWEMDAANERIYKG